MQIIAGTSVDRAAFIDRFKKLRKRSASLFDLLTPDAYYAQPISLRHPIVFYEGHLAAFSFNTLNKRALGEPGIHVDLERLFARGIDPEDLRSAASPEAGWPTRNEVRAFVEEADRRVLDALINAPIEQPGHPLLDRAEAVHAILEHEAMHQETLLYMWHQLPYGQKRPPVDARVDTAGPAPPEETIRVPAGRTTLGATRGEIAFGWDNEFNRMTVEAPAFAIDRHNVTNAAFMDFVDAGGYRDSQWWQPEAFAWVCQEHIEHPGFWTRRDGRWRWRGMFEDIPLPEGWPVYVSHSEAAAHARWRGRRLPTEAEYGRAAYGTETGVERRYPWGDGVPDSSRGHFDFAGWEPQPVGRCPAGQSAWGAEDMLGNGWEWTSTVFAPFPGFTALPSYPEYSADFFDGRHYVLKGASPATSRDLLRRSFRNWFRPQYPYVYATFRCVADVPS